MRTRTAVLLVACAATIGAAAAVAQEGDGAPERHGPQFQLGAEVKLDLRHSSFQEFRLAFQAPPSFFAPGDDALYMRTPAPGTSFEVQNVELSAEARVDAIVPGPDRRLRARPLQPQPDLLGRAHRGARGLAAGRHPLRRAAAAGRHPCLRARRQGAALHQTARPPPRVVRPLGHRRGPLRATAGAARRLAGPLRLLAAARRQPEPSLHARPERARRGLRNAGDRARPRESRLRERLPDPLRHPGPGPEPERPRRAGRRHGSAPRERGRRKGHRRARLVLRAQAGGRGAHPRQLLRGRPRDAARRRRPQARLLRPPARGARRQRASAAGRPARLRPVRLAGPGGTRNAGASRRTWPTASRRTASSSRATRRCSTGSSRPCATR